MTIVLTIGLIVEFLLIIQLEHKVHKNESGIFCIDGRVDRLTHDIMGSEESIKVLSDSVRKLNGVVKDLEQKQPKVEPKNRMNTRAFIAGWDADEIDEPELVPAEEFRKNIVDICLNGTCEQKQILINTMALQNILLGQTQQCIYPWPQTHSGAMLPLWYINSRLGEGVNYVKS